MSNTSDSKSTLIDIIRHGEPIGGRRYRGHRDDPLSDKGWQQMNAAIGEHRPWDIIFSSTLSRCAAFARHLADKHELPLQLDERLKEIHWGTWEGKTPGELNAEDPDTLRRYWSDPYQHLPEGAERIDHFQQRILSAWNDIIEQYAHQHILIVGHAGVTRAVLAHVLNMPVENIFNIHVSNAAISRIEIQTHGSGSFAKLLFHDGSLNKS